MKQRAAKPVPCFSGSAEGQISRIYYTDMNFHVKVFDIQIL